MNRPNSVSLAVGILAQQLQSPLFHRGANAVCAKANCFPAVTPGLQRCFTAGLFCLLAFSTPLVPIRPNGARGSVRARVL